jgi:hypothetical protein
MLQFEIAALSEIGVVPGGDPLAGRLRGPPAALRLTRQRRVHRPGLLHNCKHQRFMLTVHVFPPEELLRPEPQRAQCKYNLNTAHGPL